MYEEMVKKLCIILRIWFAESALCAVTFASVIVAVVAAAHSWTFFTVRKSSSSLSSSPVRIEIKTQEVSYEEIVRGAGNRNRSYIEQK